MFQTVKQKKDKACNNQKPFELKLLAFFFFLTLSRAAVVLIFFTVAKKRGGVGSGADSTVSNCISGTKPVFVQSCMRTESQRGQWAESLMVHNPDFTL